MSDIAALKAAARKAAFARRGAAHASYSGTRAIDALLAFLKPHLGCAIAAYMPIKTEIDPLAAMAELARAGPVGIPVITGPGRPLEFHRWQPGADLRTGEFGVQIPVDAAPVIPEIIILPLLAFDRQGGRLGYGGGYYDRTLQNLRNHSPVLAVGFAYSAQETDRVPVAATDQPMDAIVTENGARVF